MLIQHIALVPEADGIDPSELSRVSAALQKQVTRDVSPAWGVAATVDAFPRLEDVPVGYWPILVTRDLGSDCGVRLDRDGTPYAQVEYSPEHSHDWSLDASRACIEMLVNPFGKRTVSAQSPRSDQGRVEVVLEVCAPCADVLCAYAINDVVVSDFCMPAFYEEGPIGSGHRLSMNGSIGAPFRVLPGGHLTWFDVVSESFWRRSHWGENPVDTRLGKLAHAMSSSRELLPHSLPARLRASSPAHEAFHARLELDRQHARRVSAVRAMRLRASFLSTGSEPPAPALPAPEPPRVLLMQEAREPEPVTTIDVTETIEAPPMKSFPPPLPRKSKQPAATTAEKPAPETAAPAAPAPAPAVHRASSSTAPVTILREPDRAPKNTAVVLALGALAAAAAVALVWRAGETRPEAAAPAATITTAEAATAPVSATPVAPPVPVPLAPAAPVAAPVPVTAPAPVAAAKPSAPVEAPAPPAKPKRSKPRELAIAEIAKPPAPVEPQAVVQPKLVIAPSAAPVAKEPAGAEAASASIDDLIDTRR
jgi:hypothetical protein